MKRVNKRLDIRLVELGLTESREQAQRLIRAGKVEVEGIIIDKPGIEIAEQASIRLLEKPKYVSRGGEKLAGVIAHWHIEINGRVCADIGASTGGFTDCLLQLGAQKVYAIDVGYGQLALKLRNDPRVVVMERVNARLLQPADLPEKLDLIVVDVSFISLRLILPAIVPLLRAEGEVISLVKPQFEVGKGEVGKGGLVKDWAKHRRVLKEICRAGRRQGLTPLGILPSPIKGKEGNQEYFIRWRHGETTGLTDDQIEKVIVNPY